MASQSGAGATGSGNPPRPANPGMAPSSSSPFHHPASQPQHMGGSPYPGLFRPPAHSQVVIPTQQQQQQQSPAQLQPRPPTMQAPFQIQGPTQNAILGSSSPSVPTPGSAASAKRVQQKPPPRPAGGASAMNASSPYKTAELTPANARRKKPKLPEKKLPDRVAALLPESALYTQLLEFEARVDAALARKKVDIQEALKTPPSMQKTLRIYVFNSFANQGHSASETKNAEPPSWTLRIIGRILEDGVDPDPANAAPDPNPMHPKFSYFLRRLTIALDPNLYPDNSTIVWENSRSAVPQEGFEVRRIGDKEFTANIRLELNYNPEKFKLSPMLTEIIGIEADTRARVIAGVWHYVKARKLQNPTDPSFFNCDPSLKKVFGEDKMRFALVSQKISQHLSPLPPIHLEHRVKLSGNGPIGTACYDVLVDVPFPLQKEMAVFLANTEKHKEIEACDDVIVASIKKIHEHRRRRAFFLGFSQSPVEFINALIASQSKDLKLVAGEATRNAEKERHAEFYNQPWVEDAVIRYLNRKPTPGSDAPGST